MDRRIYRGLPGCDPTGNGDHFLPGICPCLEILVVWPSTMNEIYLIRHTTPAIGKGICYGQSDLDITSSFREEADLIRQHIPDYIRFIHSSPLRRCALLAEYLFPSAR